jgi:SAM-dependent methyltransferase
MQRARAGTLFSADAAGITFELPGGVFDVCFDGHRTWSIRVPDPEPGDTGPSRQHQPWPPELARRLAGRATVSLRRPGSPDALAAVEASFGGDAEGPDLRDRDGQWLSVNKWGRLGATFEARPDVVHHLLLDEVDRLIAVCRNRLHLDVFVTSGTLLGAVREARLLPHDDDADLAYLSAATNPADLALESYAHERGLIEAGYEVVRHSNGHLQVQCDQGLHIDLFTCFVVGDDFYEAFAIHAPAASVRLLPLGTVTLQGRTFPAPADPESLLVATYGPGWRVPDPAFRFSTAPTARRRLSNWLGGRVHTSREYWEEVYRTGGDALPTERSPFADTVLKRLARGVPVVDLGCGTGRDTLAFAAAGHPAVGIDWVRSALQVAKDAAGRLDGDVPRPVFESVNLQDRHATLLAAARLAGSHPGAELYARMLLHELTPRGVDAVMLLARSLLRPGRSLWLEFRTTADSAAPHDFDAPRGGLPPEAVAEIAVRHHLHVTERMDDTGRTPSLDADPGVARLRVQQGSGR